MDQQPYAPFESPLLETLELPQLSLDELAWLDNIPAVEPPSCIYQNTPFSQPIRGAMDVRNPFTPMPKDLFSISTALLNFGYPKWVVRRLVEIQNTNPDYRTCESYVDRCIIKAFLNKGNLPTEGPIELDDLLHGLATTMVGLKNLVSDEAVKKNISSYPKYDRQAITTTVDSTTLAVRPFRVTEAAQLEVPTPAASSLREHIAETGTEIEHRRFLAYTMSTKVGPRDMKACGVKGCDGNLGIKRGKYKKRARIFQEEEIIITSDEEGSSSLDTTCSELEEHRNIDLSTVVVKPGAPKKPDPPGVGQILSTFIEKRKKIAKLYPKKTTTSTQSTPTPDQAPSEASTSDC
ncbi:hypothetical protein [Wenzhou pacific spadenose shark paramyxovirus]|uniref:Uncharacterized protein n=1 Tax=Wenzhou pacific spadenose shark paramyxovirus TaxID=2116452 RepID=A0A2P1GNF7_9MONO|nr:hypothetical protein QKD25_gp04 [Wenzhou pacific spadenose shark paramyxovirus]AVM87359.1 hypothetical protein [Wenzhou pacific spadenose shark paramyxovirus]